jgi:hypothetical protein
VTAKDDVKVLNTVRRRSITIQNMPKVIVVAALQTTSYRQRSKTSALPRGEE